MTEARTKRSAYVQVHRDLWHAIGLLLAGHLVDSIQGWTGWHFLVVFAFAARVVAVVYVASWLATRNRAT